MLIINYLTLKILLQNGSGLIGY